MAVRKKRSISVPPGLDAEIEAAARAAGVTYSAWLAATARKEILLQEGLDGVAEFERTHGALTAAELGEAEAWAHEVLGRRQRSATAGGDAGWE
jgi:hypothetical protein